jgi:SAM-dependent methyltransferase
MTQLQSAHPPVMDSAPNPVEPGFHGPSYERTIARFDAADVAGKYPPAFGKSFRERREVRCIRQALRHIPFGGEVLDLPCGTGRLIPLLAAAGFQVTAADASPHMAALAEGRWRDQCDGSIPSSARIEFDVQQVLKTSYRDEQFDGVICNRLFHHFNESETRIAAMEELGRICRGNVIVSFFNSFALDALKFRLKHALRGTLPTDRIPIPMSTFEADADQAGLKVISRLAVMWGISPMWYLVLARK